MDRYNIIGRSFVPHPSVTKIIKFGEYGSVPIDQQPAKRFNIDPSTGRPIDDLTAILRAQNMQEQSALMERLTEYKAEFLPADMSDEDALMYMSPRLCQLPSELAEHAESVTRARLHKQEKERLAKLKEEFLKTSVESDDKNDDESKED